MRYAVGNENSGGRRGWAVVRYRPRRSMRKARCVGRKLLILRPGWQGFMGLGVVDHLSQKLLAERRQRAFPQFPGGLTLPDEAPFLRGDRARIHPVGKMVHGAAGDRIAFL